MDVIESHWSLNVEDLSKLWLEGDQTTEDGERDATLLPLKSRKETWSQRMRMTLRN